MVLHTFGWNFKWNPHIHCLISEGGHSDDGYWRNVHHFNYTYLRNAFRTALLNEMESIIGPSFKKSKPSVTESMLFHHSLIIILFFLSDKYTFDKHMFIFCHSEIKVSYKAKKRTVHDVLSDCITDTFLSYPKASSHNCEESRFCQHIFFLPGYSFFKFYDAVVVSSIISIGNFIVILHMRHSLLFPFFQLYLLRL